MPKPSEKPTRTGRRSTVDYERPVRTLVHLPLDVANTLDRVVLSAHMENPRAKSEIDKSLVVERALRAYFKQTKVKVAE